MMMDERSRNERESSEERKLELRLGPPGSEEDWRKSNIGGGERGEHDDESRLSLSYFSTMLLNNAKNIPSSPWSSSTSSCYNNNNEKKSSLFSPPNSSPSSATNTAVPNTSQKRTAPGPVVGWPPIRSFRKNLANSNSSSKLQTTESPHHQTQQQQQHNKVVGKKLVDNNNNYGTSSSSKGLFVKINMDGVPIGRKVDLNAYDTYENLSSAVDDLFRGLLAAQRDSSNKKKQEEEKAITGLLDGSGEYTLVYEDNEGDRMLVGDVPWHMFVSTVKRLRVLKSSELSAFTHGTKQDKIST